MELSCRAFYFVRYFEIKTKKQFDSVLFMCYTNSDACILHKLGKLRT
jgi:hypothetical protein